MEIAGSRVLVLGGHGLVGQAVCRELLKFAPTVLLVASRRRENAQAAVEALGGGAPDGAARIEPT